MIYILWLYDYNGDIYNIKLKSLVQIQESIFLTYR